MWTLIPENDPEEGEPVQFNLLAGKQYSLGRTNTDFTISNDKSISRTHAILEVTHPEANVAHPHKPPVLTIRDSSKFGTVIRDEKMIGKEQVVKNGDTVKFGTVTSIYRAVYEPYIVTTSCLDPTNKRQTKALILRLGGHVVSDWRRECSLLVMTSLSVTVKVICALVSLKPIVTVQYLADLCEAIEAKKVVPNSDNYTPPLAESQLNPNEVSFKKDARRQTLLQGKVFVFLNPKQFKKLNIAVELAGGTPMLMEEGTDNGSDDILIEPTTCVMHADPNDPGNQLSQNAHDWVKHVLRVLRKHGRRAIPDCELGFAVLYCSTDRYCNPSIDCLPSQASSQLPSQSLSQQVAPAPSQSERPTASSQQHSPSPANRNAAQAGVSACKTKIKEEPESQHSPGTAAPSATTTASKKRLRSEEDNVESKEAKMPRIKAEVPSPAQRRSTRRSPSPVPTSPASDRRHSRPDETPASPETPKCVRRGTTGANRSPSPDRRNTRSRSPSPAPTTKSHKAPSPKPSPRKGKKTDKLPVKSSRSPSPSPVMSPKSEAPEEEVDEFDAFQVQSRRKQGKLPVQGEKPVGDSTRSRSPSNPSSRKKRKAEEEPEDVKPQVQKRSRQTEHTVSPASSPVRAQVCRRSSPVLSPEHSPDRSPPLSPALRVKRSPVDNINHDGEEVSCDPPEEAFLENGFLTTRIPTKNSASRRTHDDDVPEGAGTITKSAPLTVPRRERPPALPAENNNTINGKIVKNYKNFRKVGGAGSARLPRIIGGSDLRPHVNDGSKMDEWFKEDEEKEPEVTAAERAADDMFNWQPSAPKGKKPPARKR